MVEIKMGIDNKKAWKEVIAALALVLDLEEDLDFYHAWRVAVISAFLAEDILPEQKSDVFSQVIDAKHAYTAGHSKRVSKYSLLIAISMNLAHDEVTRIKWAGLVHDIGKVANLPSILDKASELSEGEYDLYKKHTVYTEEILGTISSMKELAPMAATHHERFDGDGYHRKLKGEDIPLGARILAVADTFDSITSLRGYRDAGLIPNAIGEIQSVSKTQFDPVVVEAAIPIFESFVDN